MRSDELLPYLMSDTGNGLRFKRGVVVTWNTTTGANTVNVDGVVMTNLELLTTSDKALIATNDVVSILVDGPTWAIWGKVTKP
jgi:hypothetical protein